MWNKCKNNQTLFRYIDAALSAVLYLTVLPLHGEKIPSHYIFDKNIGHSIQRESKFNRETLVRNKPHRKKSYRLLITVVSITRKIDKKNAYVIMRRILILS